MLFKQISPNGQPLQLPGLKLGKFSTDYIDTINMFYELNLSAASYRKSQVYLNAANKPTLELVPMLINANNDILKFESRVAVVSPELSLVNPVANKMINFLPVSPARVVSKSEMAFLENVEVNAPRNIFMPSDTVPDMVALMLNSIPGQPKWAESTNYTFSTGGFLLEYYGPVQTAPSDYFYPEDAKTVAVFQILQGKNTGKLMVYAHD